MFLFLLHECLLGWQETKDMQDMQTKINNANSDEKILVEFKPGTLGNKSKWKCPVKMYCIWHRLQFLNSFYVYNTKFNVIIKLHERLAWPLFSHDTSLRLRRQLASPLPNTLQRQSKKTLSFSWISPSSADTLDLWTLSRPPNIDTSRPHLYPSCQQKAARNPPNCRQKYTTLPTQTPVCCSQHLVC